MTDFAIRYSYFDRKLGKSGHGEAIVRIEREGDGDSEESEGEGQGQGEKDEEDAGGGEGLDLDDPHHREAIELQIREALTREYPEHQHGHLVVIVLDCSQVDGNVKELL